MSNSPNTTGAKFLIIGLVAIILCYSCIFTVNERELAVVLQFGKVVKSVEDPGLYFKIPLMQEVRRLPRTRQFWKNSPNDILVDLPTKDGKKIEISIWAIWRINDAEQFVKVMRTVDNAEQQVRQRVRAGIRDVITSYNLSEVVRSTDRELTYSFGLEDLPEDDENAELPSADLSQVGEQATIRIGREKIMEEIRRRIETQIAAGDGEDNATDRGIELVDVGISNIGFVESVRRAAFERLRAFMEAIAARYRNEGEQRKQEIINEANAEAEKIRGEGEEQSKRIRGEVEAEIIESYASAIKATGDFYNFQRTLEVYEKALGSETRMILTTDSDLLRMLKQVEVQAAPKDE
ncbi:MAG: protease modulator HflC [Planctomycetaceae bacterium]|nr:protease modulator HflC [Planctomycetaceae bacterium]